MLEMLYPGEYLDSTYEIDFERLAREGYRGLIFDIDNTLVPHGAPRTNGRSGCLDGCARWGMSAACCLTISFPGWNRFSGIYRYILLKTRISRLSGIIKRQWN